MDLSIRVIAFNTCATKVASHQGTHTYRLSKFLKINAAPPKTTPAAKRRNYPIPTKNRQEEKRINDGFFFSRSRYRAWPPQKRCALYRSNADGQYALKKYRRRARGVRCSGDRDLRKPALPYLEDDCFTYCNSARLVRNLVAIHTHPSLLDHPHGLRRTRRQPSLLQDLD